MCGITSTLHRRIGRGGRVPWSQDLTPLDYFLSGSMGSMVIGNPKTSEEHLMARVHGAIESLTRQLHLLGQVRKAQNLRCRTLCNNVGGTQFEPRL